MNSIFIWESQIVLFKSLFNQVWNLYYNFTSLSDIKGDNLSSHDIQSHSNINLIVYILLVIVCNHLKISRNIIVPKIKFLSILILLQCKFIHVLILLFSDFIDQSWLIWSTHFQILAQYLCEVGLVRVYWIVIKEEAQLRGDIFWSCKHDCLTLPNWLTRSQG